MRMRAGLTINGGNCVTSQGVLKLTTAHVTPDTGPVTMVMLIIIVEQILFFVSHKFEMAITKFQKCIETP